VAADIPGLIEGAADGAGLGHDFLRHVDRCRLLLHVVDISCFEGRDPNEDVKAINEELVRYNETLASRPQIVAANKCDIVEDPEMMERFRIVTEGEFADIEARVGREEADETTNEWQKLAALKQQMEQED
jgi:GTP-binding protein